MALREVTPNRRGMRSRELVLDAAERVMAEHGYEAATLARVVEEAGIPMSSVYHYFGSKDGILLAVMARGADRFFADLPEWSEPAAGPEAHLARLVSGAVRTLERHPSFLRLLIGFAAQPPAAGGGEVQAVVGRVRSHALELLRAQIAVAFGDDPHSPVTDQLARFALAAFDGAFLASQSDPDVTLERLLQPLVPSLTASRRELLAGAMAETHPAGEPSACPENSRSRRSRLAPAPGERQPWPEAAGAAAASRNRPAEALTPPIGRSADARG